MGGGGWGILVPPPKWNGTSNASGKGNPNRNYELPEALNIAPKIKSKEVYFTSIIISFFVPYPQNPLRRLHGRPTYPIEQFGNRTQSNTNHSIAELNRTHNRILPIEHNRTFDYRTIGNRTHLNIRLPND